MSSSRTSAPSSAALRSGRGSREQIHGQQPRMQSPGSHESPETRTLLSDGLLHRMPPPRIGQGGPHQIDGPAQIRVGFRLETIGPGQAPVEVILGWSPVSHDPEGTVDAQLVGAVTATPRLRSRANVGGEPGAFWIHPYGVATERSAERP